MDVNTITTIITDLGFPIAVCCYMFWHETKMQEQFTAQLDKERESHTEEMTKVKEALDNNTKVMTKIYERLGGVDNGNA